MGGGQTGPNPTDRGKLGTKRSVISEAAGISAGLASDGANRSEHAKALRADLGHRARRRVVERIHASINRYRSLLVR